MGTVQFQPVNMIYICTIVFMALGLSWPTITTAYPGKTTMGEQGGPAIEVTTITEGTTGTKEDTERELQSDNCRAAPAYSSYSNMDGWCKTNCARGYCPSSHCTCDNNVWSRCKAVGIYAKHLWMDKWCEDNCRLGYCPPSRCNCQELSCTQDNGLAQTGDCSDCCSGYCIRGFVTTNGQSVMHKQCVPEETCTVEMNYNCDKLPTTSGIP